MSRRDTLLIGTTAPVIVQGDRLRLDVKFVEGMRLHRAHWPGPVRALVWLGARTIPFGASYDPADLDFELVPLSPKQAPDAALLRDVGAVFASADGPSLFALAPLARAAGARQVWSLEYTLETRLRIAALDPQRSLPRRVWSMLWNLRVEIARRRVLRAADGVQFNGYPAWDSYHRTVRSPLLYLDNRMRRDRMASPEDTRNRSDRLRSGAPLRLIHSGRLEPMKGAQDLLPVMRAIQAMGITATLDIYGTGSLEDAIRAALPGFGGRVRLHGAVDFDTELVPASRTAADIFLSCHRQSDPSCTYLEAMGCGLAVAGYDNRMWRRLAAESGGGRIAPMGRVAALAAAIADWDRDRAALIAAQSAALAFAWQHGFEHEFAARMHHLRRLVGL